MSNRRRWSRVTPHSTKEQLNAYANALMVTGMEEREVARAFFYAEKYGLDSLSNNDCVTFAEPNCGDWDCVRPDHQVVVKH